MLTSTKQYSFQVNFIIIIIIIIIISCSKILWK